MRRDAYILRGIAELRTAVVMPVATERGGAEATLFQLIRHADPDARWLVVFLEDGPMVAKVRALGGEAEVIHAGRVRYVPRAVQVVRELAGLLRRWRPDVIVSWMSKAHIYAAPVATAQRVPALWFQHGLPSRTDPIDALVSLLPARGVFAPSRTVAAVQGSVWPHRTLHVAYPGVELDELTPGAAPTANGLLDGVGVPDGAPVIGMVARLQSWKGAHVLVEALPTVLETYGDAHVVIVGGDHVLEPGYREIVLGLAQRLGVAARVHLAGQQPDARDWMRAFDVVVHASDNEPFGLVVVEAMALGKPVVAGSAGGPAEVVRDGVEGFLVDYGDSAELASRILAYLGDPELARRMGAAAVERARDFTAAGFSHEVLKVLRAERRAR